MADLSYEMHEVIPEVLDNPEELPKNIEQTTVALRKSTDELAKNIGSIMNQTEADIEQGLILGTDSKEEIGDKLDKMVDKIEDKTNIFEKTTIAMLEQLLNQNAELRTQNSNLKEDMAKLEAKVTEMSRPLPQKFGDAVRNATNAVIGFIKDAGEHIKGFAEHVVQAAKTAATSMKNTVEKFFDEKIKQPVKDTIQNLRDAVDTAKRTIESAKINTQSKLIEAKDKVLNTLTKPLLAQLKSDTDKQASLAQRLEALKNGTDIDRNDKPERD